MLGEGGMGAVYEAEKLSTHEIFAVKLIRGHLADDPMHARRFVREVEALRAIRHPNVVNVFEWSVRAERSGVPAYVVMEYLEGESLGDRLRHERRLAPTAAIPIMLQVLEGLAAAHEIGVLHRDLGPSNVFLQRGPRDQVRVRLLDFGLARPLNEETDGPQLTQEGTVMGKPGYVAPEMIDGGELDARSDLFACGMLLYRMLAGRLPFDAGTSQLLWIERWAERRNPREYRPPSDFSPGIPAELDAVVRRAVRRRPAERFASAREMQRALLEAEKHLPVAAPPAAAREPALPVAAPAAPPDPASHTAAGRTTSVPVAGLGAPLSTRLAQVIAVCAAVVIVGFLLLRWAGGMDDGPPPVVEVPPRMVAPVADVPDVPREVRLGFLGLPPGARVRVAGEPVPDPIAGLRLPRSTTPVDVSVDVPSGGWEPWSSSVVPDRDVELRPALRLLPPPPADASSPAPAAGAGTGAVAPPPAAGGEPADPVDAAATPPVRDAAPTDSRSSRRDAGASTASARDASQTPATRDAARVEGRHGTSFQTQWEGP
jgi:serine/threonine-protein kinase